MSVALVKTAVTPLQTYWRYCNLVLSHQRTLLTIPQWKETLQCLLKCLLRRRSKKTSGLHGTGLCEGNSPVNNEFPAQRSSNAENVSIWWSHHEYVEANLISYWIQLPWLTSWHLQWRKHCLLKLKHWVQARFIGFGVQWVQLVINNF